MMSAEEDSTSSPDDDPYDDTDILNSAGTDEVTAHLAAAGKSTPQSRSWDNLRDGLCVVPLLNTKGVFPTTILDKESHQLGTNHTLGIQ